MLPAVRLKGHRDVTGIAISGDVSYILGHVTWH